MTAQWLKDKKCKVEITIGGDSYKKPNMFFVQISNPISIVEQKRTLLGYHDVLELNGIPIEHFTKVGEIYGLPVYQFIPDGVELDFVVKI